MAEGLGVTQLPQDFNKIAIVGEAPGQDEAIAGRPFIGKSGKELAIMLAQAGISKKDCLITNVFHVQPPGNDIYRFCLNKKDSDDAYREVRDTLIQAEPDFEWPEEYDFGFIKPGKYIKPELLTVLPKLRRLINTHSPNITLALGNVACWALLGTAGITKSRGTVALSTLCPTRKILPSFHPAYILRAWGDRTTSIIDFQKANRESRSPNLERVRRTILIPETLEEVIELCRRHYNLAPHLILSYDIETYRGQITCIGFAVDKYHAFVIPIEDRREEGSSYWSEKDEPLVWREIKGLMEAPCRKVAQNGVYDIQYLWEVYGICPMNCSEDTMLLHHAIQPELKKDLGFLGSVYTNEIAWKSLNKKRGKGRKGEEKRDA